MLQFTQAEKYDTMNCVEVVRVETGWQQCLLDWTRVWFSEWCPFKWWGQSLSFWWIPYLQYIQHLFYALVAFLKKWA